ncbi:hypothetical protein IFT72_03050 [Frigoribacterium sp. CFBP 8754]|uniref:LamG-like jellyroll fold domain-containing protein n=1 Tax=Frigoribacterium sp. CFBP 8754 TaxID=2775290 RepID=UPI00177CDF8F|nr:hypothetical protein [Frigoribacterium sp. CFBP 8754]
MPHLVRSCPGDLPVVAVATAARTALWTVALLALWCVLPAAAGWAVTTVASDSMAPRLRTGDVVAAVPIDGADAVPGQVLLVDDPDHADRLRLHRLVRTGDEGLRLRGDANAADDSSPVSPAAVHGAGVLRVPAVGLPGVWLRQGAVAPILLLVAAASVISVLARADRDVRQGLPCRRCGAPRWETDAPSVGEPTRASGPVRLAAGALVVVAVAAAGTTSDAAFSATTGSAVTASTDTFPCFGGPLVDDPVLAWGFSEPRGGDVRDESGHGHLGRSASGPVRNDAPCDGDPSMSLDAPDARVQSTVVGPAPSTFSVEAWFRTESAGGRIVGYSSSTSAASPYKDRHLYVGADGTLHFGVQGSNDFRFALGGRSVVTDGEWHHAVGTFRPGSTELWLDGELQGRRTDARALKAYNGSWRVGRESLASWAGEPTDYTLRGDVDTVRVYDTALDAAAVAAHHAAGR